MYVIKKAKYIDKKMDEADELADSYGVIQGEEEGWSQYGMKDKKKYNELMEKIEKDGNALEKYIDK